MSSSLDEFAKLRIPLDDIVLATNNFANENLVKEDGIVKIYKGKLSLQSDEWIDVDVWRLVGMDDLKRSEFLKKIQVLSNLKHENLISIIGFCDENDDRIIVIEQAVYGSLDQHLHDPTLITWSQRLKICLGFVHGFWYLHQNRATHDDIGCSRVLLNKDWEAKVSCFGLSPENDLLLTFHTEPIYELRKYGRNISPSFGKILLEVLWGRKPNRADEERYAEKTFHETIDPTLRAQMHSQSLNIFLEIVYGCLGAQQDVFMHQIKCNLENALEFQLKHEYIEKNMGHLKIPLTDIVSATNNFSKRYLIRSDDYVKLYKAELSQFDRKSSSTTEASVGSKVSQSRGFSAILNLFARIAKGSEGSGKGELPRTNINVAIKHLTYDKNGKRAKDLFDDFETLIGCKHENIASPLGFSWEGSRMILVYEYPCKGHLCDYLRSTNEDFEDLSEDSETLIGCKRERTSPTWEQRIQISLDIARGMDYFFNNMEMVKKSNILEKGVTSENILLGDEWNAKIASFRFLETSVGMDRYRVSREIYSLGVLLMEILSGRLATYLNNQIGEELDSNLLKKLVDPKILEEVHELGYTKKIGPNQDSLDAFSKITYRCMAKNEAEEKEPTLAFVIQELEKALHFQLQWRNLEHLKIPFTDVELATEKFAERYQIGSGGYANVYKAELKIFCRKGSLPQERKNSTVAIKRISSRTDEEGNEGFLAEVEVLSRWEHPKVVSLLGFCVEGPEKILIYELAENGSLGSHLGRTEPKIYLTWSQRIKLCLDVACGLNYLHTSMKDKNRIIHRDIKSDNILLDKNWQAKIADFGLSKIQPMNQDASTIVTSNIVGTYVYWDPEYKRTGRLKKESDIYSLGVVFFENLFGKLAYHFSYMAQNDNGLAPIARRHFDEGTLKEMIDPKIMEEAHELDFTRKVGPNQQSLDVFSNIAYQCVAKTQAKRPTMESVIKELEKALDLQDNYIPKISLTDVNSATENFSDKNFIRTGGYGKVYNGSVVYNTGIKPVLVKRLHKTSQEHNFLTELEIISMHKHENVIGLVGYCKEMDEKIIVYEHMSKGSLDMHLNKVSLGWKKRLKICIDVARGLEFLHGSIQREDVVIHRDIKSSSILLNGDWKAKISDFEQSLITPADRKRDYVMNDVVGTLGYCEYPLNWDMGFLSKESDIYSFGVVLFEIYCGRLTMENFKATGQYLDSFVIDCFKQGKLDEIVFKDIKEHIAPQSLTTFQMIAYQCLHRKRQKRPTIGEVVVQLIQALQYQDDHEIWELKLPIDYKDIFQLSKSPDIYSTKSKKDLYDMLSEGIVLQDGKVWFSFGSTGERTELVSARTFSYINHCLRRWRSIKESRFEKVVEMLDIKNLMIKIKTKAHFLSPGTVYGVYLVFKFCDSRKISSKPTYVNLQYRKGGKSETLNAFFSTRRDEEWMMIELFRFLNHNDNTVFEFLLQSISPYYCGHDTIYVEGVEFRVIENASLDISKNSTQVKDEETEKLEEVSPELKLNSNASKFQRSKNNDELFWLNEVNGKKHLVLSAKKVLYDLSNEKLFTSKSLAESSLLSEPIFEEVIELRPQQVFRIKCKFESQKLSPDTDYSCYLVFRLSDKCRGLYCPVKVRNLLQRRNKESEIIYFRSPSPWNLHDNNHVPKQRKDGWMEVKVWKLNSSHQLKMDHINVNLTYISYEGTMAGLIVCALEFRPM